MASVACIAAAGALGLAVARWMQRRGAPRGACIATIAFGMVNPLVWEAVRGGTPEQVIAGVLCTGLVLAALRSRIGVGLVLTAVAVSFVALVHSPLSVVLAVPLGAAWWRSPRRTPDDALALLALLLLPAAILDPADHVPFLLSLTAWEGLVHRRVPVVSMGCAIAATWSFAAAAVPVALWLAVRLYVPRRRFRRSIARPIPV
jgi:hypothetical protein